MKEYIPPEQLLTRILHVAQLLAYTESSTLASIRVDQYVEQVVLTIIDAKDNSGATAEKLPDDEKM